MRCAASVLLLFALHGCGSGGSGGGGSGLAVGTVEVDPNTGLSFIVEASRGGSSSAPRLTGLFWGRLVDVTDVDGVPVFRDFVIGENIETNAVDYELERNPVTEIETLVILHSVGTPAFDTAFGRIESGVQQVLDRGLGANVLPPYTMVPRNAALVLRFDDLIAESSVNEDTVRLEIGYPPNTPYELRVFSDPNHGDLVGGKVQSTRIVLDLTVSKLEAQLEGLPINSLGLPEAVTTSQPNLVVRIPTRKNPAAGQFELLTNLSGSELSFAGSGSNDPLSPTLDVVRAMRSGGSGLGDPNNGFLRDRLLPEVVGAQGVSVFIESGPSGAGADEFVVAVDFATVVCATQPRVGDVIELPEHVLQVTRDGGVPQGGSVSGVSVVVVVGEPATLFAVSGQYRTVWDPATGALPECFVRFSPPAGTLPNLDVKVGADVLVSFSEPLDPASVTALENFTLRYDDNPNGINPLYGRVVGQVRRSLNLLDYAFEPALPLRHQQVGESYTFTVATGTVVAGTRGVTDLAGNELRHALPPVSFKIDPSEPTIDTSSVSLTFSSTDEDGNGAPEVRGQFLYDLVAGRLKPRAPTRFSAQADPNQPTVGSMVPIQTPIQTPLSNLGSKMMGVWRYHDLGFTLLDDTNHNLDVEGLWWEPFSGNLQTDYFPQFQMILAHSHFLPDERLTTGLLPFYPQSGLSPTFDANYLDPAADPPTVVHQKPSGYQLLPLSVVPSPNGRAIAPWPMNRGVPRSQFKYWTWRDTAVTPVAAPNGSGADTRRLMQVGSPGLSNFYPVDEVPTIALPLLMEFRTYHDAGSTGQNGFKIAIAINSSARPYFRTFSTGWVYNNTTTLVHPDTQTTGAGGLNPNTGNTTWPQDNAFYYGQADFIVRVSRLHTIWLDNLGASTYAAPVLEPPGSEQPSGTQVLVAYRGAAGFPSGPSGAWENASNLSPYGDSYTALQHGKLNSPGLPAFTVAFHPTSDWTPDLSALDGAQYVQARFTLISNAETQLTPTLSGLGLAAFH
jgi:hypothetical protein